MTNQEQYRLITSAEAQNREKDQTLRWSTESQNKLAQEIQSKTEKDKQNIREVADGDTLGAIVKGLNGKLDYSMAVEYRSRKIEQEKKPTVLADVSLIYPGQKVWVENGVVIIDDAEKEKPQNGINGDKNTDGQNGIDIEKDKNQDFSNGVDLETEKEDSQNGIDLEKEKNGQNGIDGDKDKDQDFSNGVDLEKEKEGQDDADLNKDRDLSGGIDLDDPNKNDTQNGTDLEERKEGGNGVDIDKDKDLSGGVDLETEKNDPQNGTDLEKKKEDPNGADLDKDKNLSGGEDLETEKNDSQNENDLEKKKSFEKKEEKETKEAKLIEFVKNRIKEKIEGTKSRYIDWDSKKPFKSEHTQIKGNPNISKSGFWNVVGNFSGFSFMTKQEVEDLGFSNCMEAANFLNEKKEIFRSFEENEL
ncbi:MSCRAMM family adhesin SdrC [Candidatus Gracilibacteria bacterium]|nr:MSCRAMM family adhesin SdrC [Candidatus Gracilibacteria bacterium]MCF7819266.1 MSCRAMM family adhesin SdrC [Candidatus Gracilibacteria bacterium]